MRPIIDMMCKQCIYDPNDKGSWRDQVQRCTMPECSLYDVRPLPGGGHAGGGSLRKRIDLQCKECIYDPDDDGTWRSQVQRCASGHCALHDVRPLPLLKRESKEKSMGKGLDCESEINSTIPVPCTPAPKSDDRSIKVRFTAKLRGKPPSFNRVLSPSNLTPDFVDGEVKNDR